jgi:hypothetical protein
MRKSTTPFVFDYHKKGLFPVLRPQDFGMGCLDSFLVESKYLGTNLLGRGLVGLQCAKKKNLKRIVLNSKVPLQPLSNRISKLFLSNGHTPY